MDREWENLKKTEVDTPDFNNDLLKRKIRRKIESKKPLFLKPLKIAATITILISISGMSYYILNSKVRNNSQIVKNDSFIEKIAEPGKKMKLELPDGSKIHLNSASLIRIPRDFGKNDRSIYLEGEAFFDVKRDKSKPFIINSNGVITEVLGTSFNVSSFENENTVVTVKSGRVSVKPDENLNGSEVVLTRGNQATYISDKRELLKQEVNITDYLAWRDGVLKFNHLTLEQAAIKMERWYGVKISFEDEDLRYNIIHGSYKNETLNNVLKSLKFIHKIKYKIIDTNKIIIHS